VFADQFQREVVHGAERRRRRRHPLVGDDQLFGSDRITRDGLKVLAYRFDNDRWCTGQRFAAYRALLGDAFDGRVLPGSSANTDSPPFFREVVGSPHSVVTAHLVDEKGHPTLKARDEILAFLADRLSPSS